MTCPGIPANAPPNADISDPMTNILTRIISGGPERHTRLHDEKGNLTAPVDMLRDVPCALLRTIAEKLGYKGSALPWWPAPVIRTVAGLINRDWQVLEFGSGRSTLWLARHAGHVITGSRRIWTAIQSRTDCPQPASTLRLSMAVSGPVACRPPLIW